MDPIQVREQHQKILTIQKLISNGFYSSLGEIDLLMDEENFNILYLKVIPHEGFHSKIPYYLKLTYNWNPESFEGFPLIHINSELFDKIKTNQYLKNLGKAGIHKGICVKNLSYSYNFKTNFKKYCDNKWENYIYYLITIFNNMEDFEKGNGFKSNYREILKI